MERINQNPHAVLNDIAELFRSRGIDITSIINALSYTSFCILTFEFGEIEIEITTGDPLCSLIDNDGNKTMTLSIELERRRLEYEYNIKELRELIKSWKNTHSSLERSYS